MNKEDILKRGWGRECGRGTKTMKSISEDSVVIRKMLPVNQKAFVRVARKDRKMKAGCFQSGQRDEGGPGCGKAYLQSCLFMRGKNCSSSIQS